MNVKNDIAFADGQMVAQLSSQYCETVLLPKTATNEQNAEFFNHISGIRIEVRAQIIKAFEDTYGIEFEDEETECAKLADQA